MNWKAISNWFGIIAATGNALAYVGILYVASIAPNFAAGVAVSLPLMIVTMAVSVTLYAAYYEDLPPMAATYKPSLWDALWCLDVAIRLMPKWDVAIKRNLTSFFIFSAGFHLGTVYLSQWRYENRNRTGYPRLITTAAIKADKDYW